MTDETFSQIFFDIIFEGFGLIFSKVINLAKRYLRAWDERDITIENSMFRKDVSICGGKTSANSLTNG